MRKFIAFLFLSLFTQAAAAAPTDDQLASVPDMFRQLLIEHGQLLDTQQGNTPEGKHQRAKFLALFMVDFAAALDAARNAAWDAAWFAARDAARDAAWFAARDAAREAAWSAAWDAAKPKVLAALGSFNLTDPTEIGKHAYKLAEYFVLAEMLTDNPEKYEGFLKKAYQAALPKISEDIDHEHILTTIAEATWEKPELAENHFAVSLWIVMLGNPYWTPQHHQNLPKPARDNVVNIMLSFQRNNDSSQTMLPVMPTEMVLAMLRDLRLSDLLPSPSEEQQVNLPLPDSSEEVPQPTRKSRKTSQQCRCCIS